jgi:hypothetical protein
VRAFYGFQLAMENIHGGEAEMCHSGGGTKAAWLVASVVPASPAKHPDSRHPSSKHTQTNTHAEMYSALLETYVSDAAERLQLLSAIETIPVIQKKAQWALK